MDNHIDLVAIDVCHFVASNGFCGLSLEYVKQALRNIAKVGPPAIELTQVADGTWVDPDADQSIGDNTMSPYAPEVTDEKPADPPWPPPGVTDETTVIPPATVKRGRRKVIA